MEDIRNVPIREKAYNLLRDSIITGKLKPGERLVEDVLAQDFQVSRTPLREALHKLELDGFVVKLPKRGLMVAEVSIEEAKELYDVRACLDGLASRLTVEHLTNDDIRQLRQIRQDICQTINAKDYEKLKKLDSQFHGFIHTACRHGVCIDHLNRLYPHLSRYRNIADLYFRRKELSPEEHIDIIDLIIARKGPEAELKMKTHIFNARTSLIEILHKILTGETL